MTGGPNLAMSNLWMKFTLINFFVKLRFHVVQDPYYLFLCKIFEK